MIVKIKNGVITRNATVPKKFKNATYNFIGGFDKLPIGFLETLGYYFIETPPLTEYQRIGKISIAEIEAGIRISPIVDWTQEEIDAKIEADEDAEVTDLLQMFERDGNEFYTKVRLVVQKNYKNDVITEVQYKGIKTILEPALRPLKLGDWDLAKDSIALIDRPTNVKMATLYDFVKTKVDAYDFIKEKPVVIDPII